MRKTVSALALAMIVLLPSISLAEETTPSNITATASTTDCSSAPTVPTAPATIQQRTDYRTALQTYRQCTIKNRQGQRETLTAERQTLRGDKEQFTQDRCDIVNGRITDKLNNFQSKQNSDETIFGNVFKRLTNIQERLKNAGLDTTKLETDLATLKTKIDKVNTDYATFIAGLKTTQDFTCGHAQGEFMGKLKGAQGILLSVRADRMDVRKYITSTIIPDINALRKQLVKKEGTSTTENTDSTSSNIAPN